MIIGAHVIVYSTQPDADRAFLRDVLGFPHVDVGGGWLIFGLPPAEVAVHPSGTNGMHELYLMCDDAHALIARMKRAGIECEPPQSLDWGMLTHLTLPGGGKLGIYAPRHARPPAMEVSTRPGKTRARASRKGQPKSRRKRAPARGK
jgi:hypothetical protein